MAIKLVACLWTYINNGDIAKLLNKFALKIFNEDPDLSIKAAREFLSRMEGKLKDSTTQYLEKVSECPAKEAFNIYVSYCAFN